MSASPTPASPNSSSRPSSGPGTGAPLRHEPITPVQRRTAGAAMAGTSLELYDFIIFGLAAGLVFPQLFFPESDPLMGQIQAFMTFGAGFIARPLGGVVLGHLGDRIGRRQVLVLTLVATGACTVAMGLLPTYHSVGVAAPIMLVALRTLQGFFLGGEQSGAFLMVTEHAPARAQARFGGFATVGSPIGACLGILAFSGAAAITGGDLLGIGWRLPFLAAAVIVAVGLYVRLRVHESPEFERMRAAGARHRAPLAVAVRKAPRAVLAGVFVNLGFNLFIFIINTFTTGYGVNQLGIDRPSMLDVALFGTAVHIVAIVVAVVLADRFGVTTVMLAGAVFQVVFAFPYFMMLDSGSLPLVAAAVGLGYFGSGFLFGPMAAYYVRLFSPAVRFSAVSFSYQLGAVLGGGLSPFIAASLIKETGSSMAVSAYVLVGGLISLLGLYLGKASVRAGEQPEADPMGTLTLAPTEGADGVDDVSEAHAVGAKRARHEDAPATS